MPSIAITSNNERIYIGGFKNRFQALDRYPDVFCPDCKGRMHPVQAKNRRLHFRHNSSIDHCPGSSYAQHIESDEHLAAKQYMFERLFNYVQNNNELNKDHAVDIEHSLPECGKNGRKADIALIYKGKIWGVVECQFSRIDFNLIKQRIQDYAALGIESYWLLGGDANTEENRKLTLKYTGCLCFVDVQVAYSDQAVFESDLFGVSSQEADETANSSF